MRRATRRWLRALGLAAITGSRTSLGPALVFGDRGRRARAGTRAFAAMELLGDKVPGAPNRTAPLGLAFRIASAAAVVRAVMRRRGRGPGPLALGAAAAVAGAFLGLTLRRALTRRLGGGRVSNMVAGAIEDAALIAVGRRLAAAL